MTPFTPWVNINPDFDRLIKKQTSGQTMVMHAKFILLLASAALITKTNAGNAQPSFLWFIISRNAPTPASLGSDSAVPELDLHTPSKGQWLSHLAFAWIFPKVEYLIPIRTYYSNLACSKSGLNDLTRMSWTSSTITNSNIHKNAQIFRYHLVNVEINVITNNVKRKWAKKLNFWNNVMPTIVISNLIRQMAPTML